MPPFSKILVPVDFSECSLNALRVAIHIGKRTGGKLTILNSFNDPIVYGGSSIGTSAGFLIESKEEIKKEFEALGHLMPELDEVAHEFILSPYGVEEAIHWHISSHKHDLVVMGTHGASGLKQALFGSHTYSVVQNVQVPLLAIPESTPADFNLEKVMLAIDLHEEASEAIYEPLKAFVEMYNASLDMLHVSKDPYLGSEKTDAAWQLENYFKETDHSFHFRFEEPLEDALLNYIDEKQIDLMAVVKRKRSLLEGLFHKSLTRKLSFHSHTPLLILHDAEKKKD